ncbi:hypothetical protein A3A95_01475 [Candidatus Nomurabacteria bacterium RIFCSPLOWO2_01_FULL_39_18]|uniref:DUF11 domain-containing protein n=1 Tax=Candidatus Nomurabacteria bacterium RIFCSPHIGHO2_01_FULL_40_24b TaxID=1801739 RepID=A0A1F6V8G8_9BACT|nr:MAG: hypothetical protein A2647_00215 [Candidatus Nomurabacteria bacterium RIFCSPHIGHO2_01_FULL_40_24b]OGI88959.1 MAG: hypothetical protein A3A95_01475 [Candidatus Nomurabacteria bacterium RIFCSPLOWO2_01_FULL_39_18]
MPPNDKDKLNRIEELKNKLFSKNYQTKMEHRDNFTHSSKNNVPDSWKVDVKEKFKPKGNLFAQTALFKNFFIFSVAFFVLTLIYTSYVFFIRGNTVSKENIEISILGNTFTAGGEELSLVIGITNKNSSSLDLVDLVVEYPKSSQADSSGQVERLRVSLGTIPSGVVRNENIKMVLFGEQGGVVPIKVSLEYRVEGSNAIFVKDELYKVSINSTPINLFVDAPTSISPNQDITLGVKTVLNSTRPASKILLKIDYPAGFKFESSKPAPSLGNNIWNLGDLAPGAERDISITGKMLDVFEGEEKIFRVWSGSQSSKDKSMIDVVFNSISHTIAIKRPFIEAKLFINGSSEREYAVDSKTELNGEIRFTNNLETKINDLEIKAKITGNAVDRKTINARQGFYNSADSVIVWDKSSISKLREINPGDSESLSFSLSPLSLFSNSGILSSPSINIEISIFGEQSIEGYENKDLSNFESSTIRIISDVGFVAKAFYYSGPFTNKGPIPPKVETETTYTIVWTLSNSANNISKAQINSSLPSWMRFVGTISPAGEDLVYNPSSREIVWNIGNITKGTNITGAGRGVAFQVAISPSSSQVDSIPVIINDATLTGHDDFANVNVKVNKVRLNASLFNDPQFPSSGGTVVE